MSDRRSPTDSSPPPPAPLAPQALQALQPWLRVLIGYVGSGQPDLTNRQMALLMLVHTDAGPHTVRGLALRLGVSKPVVTRILNTLAGLGYLERTKDTHDRRNIFVARTAGGQAFLAHFAGLVAKGQDDFGQDHIKPG